MEEEEIWREVPGLGCEWLQVSNLGRCRTVDHHTLDRNGRKMFFHGKVLKPSACTSGRLQILIRGKLHLVNRLIAKAFVPRDDGCDYVIWKDSNKHNNAASNLKWVSEKDVWKLRRDIQVRNNSRRIGAYENECDSVPAVEFSTTIDAGRYFGVSKQAIHSWLSDGHYNKKYHGRYFLRYVA